VLIHDANQRPSASELLKHPFLNEAKSFKTEFIAVVEQLAFPENQLDNVAAFFDQ